MRLNSSFYENKKRTEDTNISNKSAMNLNKEDL